MRDDVSRGGVSRGTIVIIVIKSMSRDSKMSTSNEKPILPLDGRDRSFSDNLVNYMIYEKLIKHKAVEQNQFRTRYLSRTNHKNRSLATFENCYCMKSLRK